MDVQQIHTARVKAQQITGESGSLVDKRLGSIPFCRLQQVGWDTE
jgi:hypothetical protein